MGENRIHAVNMNNTKNEVKHNRGSRKVWRINTITNQMIEIYETIKDASCWVVMNKLTSSKEQVVQTTLYSICSGRKEKAYGYKWKYEE